MLEQILEHYCDESFLKMDGFDEAVIGVEEDSMRLIYSERKILDILENTMTPLEAVEYFGFNIARCYMGDKTPIITYDNF
jgi:hypothetical protein